MRPFHMLFVLYVFFKLYSQSVFDKAFIYQKKFFKNKKMNHFWGKI